MELWQCRARPDTARRREHDIALVIDLARDVILHDLQLTGWAGGTRRAIDWLLQMRESLCLVGSLVVGAPGLEPGTR